MVFPGPEVHLFVLWSESRFAETRILDDLGVRFVVLDVVEVRWSGGERFARNLTRMYGEALPAGSDKERHCGVGPFLAVVVEDPRPSYRMRRTGRGWRLLNRNVFDARRCYREWTGGGYRVHASDSVAEADRNLVLMLGRRGSELGRAVGSCTVRRHDADLAGTDGWTGLDELVIALRAHGAEPVRVTPPSDDRLTVHAADPWWAEHVAGGIEVAPGVREITVGGRSLRLTVLDRPSPLVRVASTMRRLVHRPAG